ncbi:hypothetical protein AXX17_AT2G19310 [Arabidopsis thaliana]|uniref:Uncharacterized protein n=1 Tax=Arabidopsis thaliana TaxID=3702 RepID=A0A178VZJ8_ARATH|nr:hypothetical protein AXX17_AT2G19310 [Arabidopsis thaliana]
MTEESDPCPKPGPENTNQIHNPIIVTYSRTTTKAKDAIHLRNNVTITRTP